jgi:hypothetical protein
MGAAGASVLARAPAAIDRGAVEIAHVLQALPVPAVVMSACRQDEVLDAARALGAEILLKPIDIAHLNRIVSGLAGRAA